MKSIYIRNFLVTGLMVLLCFIIVAAALVGIGRGFIIRDYAGDMLNTALEVDRIINTSDAEDFQENLSLKVFLTSVSNCTGNLVAVADTEGRVLLCSDIVPKCEHISRRIDGEVLESIRENGEFRGKSSLGQFLDEAEYVVVTASDDTDTGELLGYIIVVSNIDRMMEVFNNILGIAALVSLAVFLLMMVSALLYWKKMAEPLDEMAEASRHFARGDFSVRVRQISDPDDEMGALIESFNKMADSLESSEKRRTEFISNVSHELRTPMTTISGFADGILDGTIPDSDKDRYLIAIRDETRRLARLVRNMLEASRAKASAKEPGKRSSFDLTELTLQVLLSFEARATEKRLDVDPQLPDKNIMVNADKDAITRVIYNLIDNAVKFSREEGCITVRLYKDEYKAYVAIKDEGETIPSDDLPFIFDRFHKSDRSRSIDKDGVGLGLFLVKEIINQHDEDIAVRSENGVTEFVFTLALSE